MSIVVAGGTGLIGRHLVSSLRASGHEVTVVTRTPSEPGQTGWDDLAEAVDGADAVVNLVGASIGGGRWSRGKKALILDSRVESTGRLADAIASATRRPSVLVSASGISWAGDTGDELVDETTPPGDSFLAQVCVAWEARLAEVPVRWVAIRTPLVISHDALALKLMALPFRLFVGGRLGSGRQWFPWIHMSDLVSLYERAIFEPGLSGPVNAVAPEQVRNRDVAAELASVLHRPALLPAPGPMLRLVLGEQADLLLHGERAVSRVLDDFEFRFPTFHAALEEALTGSAA